MATENQFDESERRLEGFESLMPFRVQDILLVASLYDSFLLREDGRLSELLLAQSLALQLQHSPEITRVSSGAEAVALASRQPRYNLVIANVHLADMDCLELARRLRAAGLTVPVAVLAFDAQELAQLEVRRETLATAAPGDRIEQAAMSASSQDVAGELTHAKEVCLGHHAEAHELAWHEPTQAIAAPAADGIEQVFLWQGEARLLLAIVKLIEDRRNAAADAAQAGIPVVLVVEDDVRYYSTLLPEIYTALIEQSRRVLSDAYNLAHKLVRMRARPKILLARDWETAQAILRRYRPYLFGVVSDVEFPRAGRLEAEAGLALGRQVRRDIPDIPVVLQSAEDAYQTRAWGAGFAFQRKASETLLADLRQLLAEQFAFGDFVFRLADGREVGRAADLEALEHELQRVPLASLLFHGQRNDFSHWLIARTELALAEKLRPWQVRDEPDAEPLRRRLVETVADYRRQQKQLLVGDFTAAHFAPSEGYFLRLGDGSLGGKARGLAFVRQLLYRVRLERRFADVRVMVPNTLVVATDWFEQFLVENRLASFALHCTDDAELYARFLAAALPLALQAALTEFLRQVRRPLAVRSSSLLEDSLYQPFTGVYETFMLANRAASLEFRWRKLSEAIRRVYASTFTQHAKAYIRATPYRLEEEKMAVVVQELVGAEHNGRFYPELSGVVRSRNFYPSPPASVDDGVAVVALGLGRTVVDGGKALAFVPRYPQQLTQFSSVDEMVRQAQRTFYALDLEAEAGLRETSFALQTAERDGTLDWVGSTYSADNQAIYDGLSRPGTRLVTMAPLLKQERFPLAALLDALQLMGAEALGRPVEIEFALHLRPAGAPSKFGFLQMRPLSTLPASEEMALEAVAPERVLCRSTCVLGDGRLEGLRDLVVVDRDRLQRADSRQVAASIGQMNARLADVPYILIGVGRWGSRDPWLGIPVSWDQVSGARAIVEAGCRDLKIEPSQGSHFFQNLIAFRVAYFTVSAGRGEIDWKWLSQQPVIEEHGAVRHVRLTAPLTVWVSGRRGVGLIFRGN